VSASTHEGTGTLLIAGGRVVDPSRGIDAALDVLLDAGKIRAVGPNLAREGTYDRVLDATGLVVAPGFVDMHVHFREPARLPCSTWNSASA
jgi:dihydroorotase